MEIREKVFLPSAGGLRRRRESPILPIRFRYATVYSPPRLPRSGDQSLESRVALNVSPPPPRPRRETLPVTRIRRQVVRNQLHRSEERRVGKEGRSGCSRER